MSKSQKKCDFPKIEVNPDNIAALNQKVNDLIHQRLLMKQREIDFARQYGVYDTLSYAENIFYKIAFEEMLKKD